MRPRNREISIFSLSTLDVIFGALGAFMILMLGVMAAYNPDEQVVTQEELDDAEREQQTFIVVINWVAGGLADADVDLWVEANGQLHGPKPELFPGKAQPLGRDSRGPVGEESQMLTGASGAFRVFYRLHELPGSDQVDVDVNGWVIVTSREDVYQPRRLAQRSLRREHVGQMIQVDEVEIDDTGRVVPSN